MYQYVATYVEGLSISVSRTGQLVTALKIRGNEVGRGGHSHRRIERHREGSEYWQEFMKHLTLGATVSGADEEGRSKQDIYAGVYCFYGTMTE